MYEDLDFVFKVINSLGVLGVLLLVVFSFFRGYIVPTSVQAKIDAMEEKYEAKIDNLREQQRLMLEQRIKDLENLLRERELRTEQGVAMLNTFIEAQDKLGQFAKQLEDKHAS